MTTIRTILTISLFFACTLGKAQFISEISGGIGTNGLSGTITHQLNKKLILGETLSFMDWRPSQYAGPINRDGLAILDFKFFQAGAFLRWHPNGEENMYGYQKTGFYLFSGMYWRNNQDWFNFTSFFPERKYSDPQTGEPQKSTGGVNYHLKTGNLHPFLGVGYNVLGNDSKVTLQIEGGITLHGKPIGNISSYGSIEILEVDQLRLKKLLKWFYGFPLLQLNIGYNYYDIHNVAFPTRF